MLDMDLKFSKINISDLKKLDKNVKIHTQQQIDNLKNSIKKFGYIAPICIWNNIIVAGHGRFDALSQLNYTGDIQVVDLTDKFKSEAEARAYAIADNHLTAQTGFDNQLLQDQLLFLEDEGIVLDDIGIFIDEDNSIESDPKEKEKNIEIIVCPECGHTNNIRAFKKYE